MVVGAGSGTSHLLARRTDLRGFAPVQGLSACGGGDNGEDTAPALVRAIFGEDAGPTHCK
jgi:hypothetical protein